VAFASAWAFASQAVPSLLAYPDTAD